jgi:hypothetical protein
MKTITKAEALAALRKQWAKVESKRAEAQRLGTPEAQASAELAMRMYIRIVEFNLKNCPEMGQ